MNRTSHPHWHAPLSYTAPYTLAAMEVPFANFKHGILFPDSRLRSSSPMLARGGGAVSCG